MGPGVDRVALVVHPRKLSDLGVKEGQLEGPKRDTTPRIVQVRR
jgi:hypothetical protein